MEARIVIEKEVEGFSSQTLLPYPPKPNLQESLPHEIGELWVRGSDVALGYYEDMLRHLMLIQRLFLVKLTNMDLDG